MALLTVPTHLPNTDNFIPQVLGIWELIAKQKQQREENQRLWAAQNEASTQAMLANQRLEHQFDFQRQRAATEDARYRDEHAPISFAPDSSPTPAQSAASLPISSAAAAATTTPPDSSPLMGSPDFAHSVATATNAAAPSFGMELPNPVGDAQPILGAQQMPPADLLSDPAFDPYHARTRTPVSIPSLGGGVDYSGGPQTFVNPDLLAGTTMLESANTAGGGGWQQADAPVTSGPTVPAPPGSRITSYGYPGDTTPDSASMGTGKYAAMGPTGAWGPLRHTSFGTSPDVEAHLRAQGIKPRDPVLVTLQDGSKVVRTWDDVGASDAEIAAGKIPGVTRPLRGRVDFYSPTGPSPLSDKRVVSLSPVMSGGGTPPPLTQPEAGTGLNLPLPMKDRTPAQSVVASLSQMQRAGVPINRANLPHYVSVAQQMGKPDHIDPNSEAGVAARIKVGTTLANARATQTKSGEALTWVGETAFTKGGKAYRYDENDLLQPVTGKDAYGAPEEQIDKAGLKLVGTPGMENIVINKEGTLLQQASFDSKGKLSLKPYSSAGKLEHIGDTIVRVMPDNTVVTVAKVDKIAGADQAKLTEAMQIHAKAADELLLARKSEGEFFSAGRIKTAQDKFNSTGRDLNQYIIKYPFLKSQIGDAVPPEAINQPGPEKGSSGADPAQDPEAFKAAYAAAKPGEALTFQGKTYRKPGP